VDEGEEILEAAKRELLEETGYTADIKHFELIGSTYPFPGLTDLQIRFIYVENLEQTKQKEIQFTTEIMEQFEIEKDELLSIPINNQGFIDGNFTSALYYLMMSKKI
jgi:ADP-ribose pyrophosphatase